MHFVDFSPPPQVRYIDLTTVERLLYDMVEARASLILDDYSMEILRWIVNDVQFPTHSLTVDSRERVAQVVWWNNNRANSG